VNNPRALAADILQRVEHEGRSLTAALEETLPAARAADRPLIQALCYGTLRHWFRLDALARQLLRKPFKAKDADLHALILLGLHQLDAMRIPPHAAVAETVGAAAALGKGWARGLVNGVLRNFQRRGQGLLAAAEQDPVARWNHPAWLIAALREAWPEHWQAILQANDRQAPMTLRVNRRRLTRDSYLARLGEAGIAAEPCAFSEAGLRLTEACDVSVLPGFAEGAVSVQDEAAQLAAELLDAQPGERVLDVCAAPGGKTAHLLERTPEIALQALDVAPLRLQRVAQNLDRLGLQATLSIGDARRPDDWWDGRPFQRILLDAPCSATGVIRRHPDIKLLRRADDITSLLELQAEILHAIWPLLAPGGMLLYATCSVLPAENRAQIDAFLQRHSDAEPRGLEAPWGRASGGGRQILTGEHDMDGFFYTCLNKRIPR